MNNPGADQRGMSDPAPCSGTERQDKVLDEVSTKIHGGAAAVQKEDTLPPQGRQQRRPDPTTLKDKKSPVGKNSQRAFENQATRIRPEKTRIVRYFTPPKTPITQA